jgi:hypothetical protein
MSSDEAFKTITTVGGVALLLSAATTWSRRARWEADAQKGPAFVRWFSGQRQLNFELALGVLFLGLGIFAV